MCSTAEHFASKTRSERVEDILQYTPREVSRILKVSVGTLAHWRAGRGSVTLPFVKYGSSVFYRHRDIVAFQQGHLFRFTTEAKNA